MKVAIVKTGAPPADLEARFGGYPDMLVAMLGEDFGAFEVFDAQAGDLPAFGAHHGTVIMGSPSGVYDGDAWISDLRMWIHGAIGRTRLVGICFGHQIIGDALGGEVAKSEKGWGIGVHEHEVLARHDWMDPPAASLRLPVSHQDQMVFRGASTFVALGSSFCGYAGITHGSDVMTFQGHPEFTPEFGKALIEARRGARFDDATADAAIASYDQPNDRLVAAQWIRNFLSAPIVGDARIGPGDLVWRRHREAEG